MSRSVSTAKCSIQTPLMFDSATRIESPGSAATPAIDVSPWPGIVMVSSVDRGIRNGSPSPGTPTTASIGAGAPVTCRASSVDASGAG